MARRPIDCDDDELLVAMQRGEAVLQKDKAEIEQLKADIEKLTVRLQEAARRKDSGYRSGNLSMATHYGSAESNSTMELFPPTPHPQVAPMTKAQTKCRSTPAPPPTPVSTRATARTSMASEKAPSYGLASNSFPDWEPLGRSTESRQRTMQEEFSLPQHSSGDSRTCIGETLAQRRDREKAEELVRFSSVSSVARRPNIVPDRFNGKTPWRDYKQHFEACRLANSWTDSQAKVFLAASLQGAAVKVLGMCLTLRKICIV